MHLTPYLDFATETAYLAGRLTLGYFQTGVRPDFKPDDSPVTVADRTSEQLIRQRIERRFPEHAIVGEEFDGRRRKAPHSAGLSTRLMAPRLLCAAFRCMQSCLGWKLKARHPWGGLLPCVG